MTIIDELLTTWKNSGNDEQLRIICDQITKEEIKDLDKYEGPIGANIFLSLQFKIKEDKKNEHYICLEREAQNKYIVTYWSLMVYYKTRPRQNQDKTKQLSNNVC